MPTNHLYHTWIQRIRELRPNQRITQIRNFALLLYGIYTSKSVILSKVAVKIPGKAKLLSTFRQLERFLANPAIQVREWYESIAKEWPAKQAATLGEIRLVVDSTKVIFGYQLLMHRSNPNCRSKKCSAVSKIMDLIWKAPCCTASLACPD